MWTHCSQESHRIDCCPVLTVLLQIPQGSFTQLLGFVTLVKMRFIIHSELERKIKKDVKKENLLKEAETLLVKKNMHTREVMQDDGVTIKTLVVVSLKKHSDP